MAQEFNNPGDYRGSAIFQAAQIDNRGGLIAGTINNNGLNEDQLLSALARTGLLAVAETAGLQRQVVVLLAKRMQPEVLSFDQALAELERAVEIALQVITRGSTGKNPTTFVDRVLARVAAETRAGRFDEGAAAIQKALADQELSFRKERATILKEAIMVHTLRRDAAAVAEQVGRIVALENSSARPAWHPHYESRLAEFMTEGDQKGSNFSLSVACELSKQMVATASTGFERGKAFSNLGISLVRLGERESGTRKLSEALEAFREVLEFWPRTQMALQWAATQTNIGAALSSLGTRESGTTHLEEAVTAYRLALQEQTRARVPLDWAMTHNNLGYSLSILGKRETGTERLEEAETAYRAALQEPSFLRIPYYRARTQHNLATVLTFIGHRERNVLRLLEAVAIYSEALQVRTQESVPLNWAATQHGLGDALFRLGENESGVSRFYEAVAAYEAALRERKRDRVPIDWATTQRNLGRVLTLIGEREHGTLRLREAVLAYQAALLEFEKATKPFHRARAMAELGKTLLIIGERDNETSRVNEAVEVLRTCLAESQADWPWVETATSLVNRASSF